MTNREVGNTIWKQMNTIDKRLVWAMGVHKSTIIEQGLSFKVKGLSFKGLVEIVLEPNDTYCVRFIRQKRSLNKEIQATYGIKKYDVTGIVEKEYKEVYFDNLMPLMDSVVELRKCGK